MKVYDRQFPPTFYGSSVQSIPMLEYIYTEAFWYNERCDNGVDRLGSSLDRVIIIYKGVAADGS